MTGTTTIPRAPMQLNGGARIAVQKSGRLAEPSLALLRQMGLQFEAHQDRLFARCRNLPLDILFVRDDDVPEYVQDGTADLGVVGSNVLAEQASRVERLLPLDFGFCALSLAVPEQSPYARAADLAGKRIATSYPRMVGDFLAARGLDAEIVLLKGSVEIAPALGVADAVCDLSATGSTLRTNRLRVLEVVAQCQATLVGRPGPEVSQSPLVQKLLLRARGVQEARRFKYVMFNAPARALDSIRRLVPGCKSPTVVALAQEGFIAVHSMVLEESFWDVVEQLRDLGASDILVVPVEKFIR